MTLCAAAACTFAGAQGLEEVFVERYYVTNNNDAADPDAGSLAPNTVVYRIYIDMAPGYVLETVFGSPNNPLTIETTTEFFNNEDRGGLTGNDLGANFLDNGTVLLDSYVAMGAAGEGQWGVLKTADTNGAIQNSDGRIQNQSGIAGVPPRVQDGLVPGNPPSVTFVPSNSIVSQLDDVNDGPAVVINDGAWAVLGGTSGPDTDNRVLIAQIATDGDLTFELNVRLGAPDGSNETYVAANATGDDIQFDGLSYPTEIPCELPYPAPTGLFSQVVGNKAVLAWNTQLGSIGCRVLLEKADGTPVGGNIFGLDEINFVLVPASFLEPATDYRWRVRCGCRANNPQIAGPFSAFDFFSTGAAASMSSSPNPTESQSFVTFTVPTATDATLEVFDMSGRRIAELYSGFAEPSSEYRFEFDGSDLPNGVYIYRLTTNEETTTEKFMIAR